MTNNNHLTWTNDKRKLGDLIEWPSNPVQMSKRAADGLYVSLDKFGLALPFLVSPSGEIYDGHQRKNVMKAMEQFGPDAVVDVRVSSRELTKAERQELAVRLRKNTGEFDFDILANEFGVPDLVEWGFEEWELGIDNSPLPEDWPEYDEDIADDVEFIECPSCGHKFPK